MVPRSTILAGILDAALPTASRLMAEMHSIAGGYLGGHPAKTDRVEEVTITATDDGGIAVSEMRMLDTLRVHVNVFRIASRDVRGVTLDRDAKVKRKGRAAAIALRGVGGAAHHDKTRGNKNRPLNVLADIDGQERTIRLAVDPNEATPWLTTLFDARRAAGLPGVETIEAPDAPTLAPDSVAGPP